ncbi:MAG: hypothetical protein OXG24_13785 [Gammaproteobacteria bacterium]|nr:hypothetical protein [Gammaproteobacteria bacterium]
MLTTKATSIIAFLAYLMFNSGRLEPKATHWKHMEMINQLSRVVSVAAMSMAVLSYGNDSEVVEPEDKWTHSPHFSEMIKHWRKAGKPDLPVSSLPDGVADQLGIESETVPPEVLFSNEMQALLYEKLSPPIAQRVFPGSMADIGSNALPQVFLLPDVELEELKQRYAEHLGLQSADELTPQIIQLVKSLQQSIEQMREEMTQSDALLYERQFQGDVESHGIDLDTPIEPNYTEDDFARAWNALSAEDQQILEPLRHLRNQKRIFSVRLSASQQDAGSRYIRNLNAVKPHPLTAYFKQQMKLITEEKELHNRELGYSDRTTKIAPTASARETIESVIMDSFSLSAYNAGDETIYHLNSPEATNLTSSLSSVPAEYLESGSQNYLI